MSTIFHLLLALALTLFLAFQAGGVLFVLRSRHAIARAGRPGRRTDVLWTVIPVIVVLFLAARSWVAVFDLERPAVASSVVSTPPRRRAPNGEGVYEPDRRPAARAPPLLLTLLAVVLLASGCGLVGWDWDTKMTTVIPKSDFGKLTHDIFMLISWTTLVIFIAVEGALLYACWRFRDKPGAPIPKQMHGHTLLEIGWTVAFAVMLLIIGIPTIRAVFDTQEAPAGQRAADGRGRAAVVVGVHVPVARHRHRQRGPPAGGPDRRLPPERPRRHPLVLDPPARRQARRGPAPGQPHRPHPGHPRASTSGSARSTAARRTPTCASARSCTPRRTSSSGWRRRRRRRWSPPTRSPRRAARSSASRRAWAVTPSRGSPAGALGPNLTHFGSRKTFAAGLLPTTPRRTWSSGSRTPTT